MSDLELPELPEPDSQTQHAIRIAELWRAGKMIGWDEDDVREALLGEVARLRNLFPAYAKAAVLQERERLAPVIAMLEDAESPYMEGTPLDVKWLMRRDELLATIRQPKE